MASEVAKRLRDRRMNVWNEAKSIAEQAAEENRALTDEEQGRWDAYQEEMTKLDTRIRAVLDTEKRAKDADDAFDALSGKKAAPEGSPQARNSGKMLAEIRKWASGEEGAPRHMEIRRDPALGPVNYRVLTTGAQGTNASSIVPTDFYDMLIAHLIEVSGVMQCLSGDTRVITSDGVETLEQLAGGVAELLVPGQDGSPEWQKAPVSSFGVQRLWRIKMEQGSARKVIRATAGHRWLLDGGTEAQTQELQPGMQLRTATGREVPWKVVSAEATDRVEEVFCATVEGVHAFFLEDGILTGNCGPTVLNTGGGETLQVPKTTAHSTATSAAQAGTLPTSDPAFSMQPLSAWKYGVMLQVARELIDDTAVDLLGYLAMQAGRALGNAFGNALVNGSGTSEPTGIITAATTGVTGAVTGVSGAPSYANLVDLEYSVIAPYRQSRSCYWLAADKTIGGFRKITDTVGRPIWEPSAVLGSPDLLLGKPLVADPFMPAQATGAKSIAFGDFSQYFVRLVGGVRFERSDDFAFGSDLVTFRAILRGDGTLVDRTGAVKVYQGAAT